MTTPGILYVTMQPRPSLALDAFHAWYNNEHGPTRLALPEIFTSGLRYQALGAGAGEDAAPEFMAVYDVTSMPRLETPTYTRLRANRSPREAATIAQIDVRRSFFDLLHTKQAPDFQAPERRSDGEAEGMVTVAVEISIHGDKAEEGGEAYRKWYVEEHVELLAKVPGWQRSRLFKTSTLADSSPDGKSIYFCLHDYSKDNGLGGPEHKASMDTPRRTQVFDKYVASKGRRTYSLFYVFGAASRDLTTLSRLPSTFAEFSSVDGTIRTDSGSITSRVTTADGLVIPYRLEGNPAPDAPVVAFSNSLLTSYSMWDPLVSIIKQKRPDLRILRYDTRGRHAIPHPPVGATLETLTSDLDALLSALRIDKLALLIGVSMGGATATSFALRHPSRVSKFIAADFNCTSSAANTQSWKDRISIARADAGAGLRNTLAGQTVSRWFHPDTDGATRAWMTDMVAGNDVEGFAHSCTALWDYDLRPDLPACGVPGLLVVGEEDGKGALVRAMEGFAGAVGKDGAGLRVVKRAGHLPMCENPEGFWEAIEDFV